MIEVKNRLTKLQGIVNGSRLEEVDFLQIKSELQLLSEEIDSIEREKPKEVKYKQIYRLISKISLLKFNKELEMLIDDGFIPYMNLCVNEVSDQSVYSQMMFKSEIVNN